jgi:hypothetical protein
VDEPQSFAVRVAASAVRIARQGPGILRDRPDGESDTTLHFEGELDRPVIRMHTASIMVVCGDVGGNPGAAIGGTTIWHVVITLPRAQFGDLLALAVAQRVAKVELLLEGLRCGKGVVRSVSFASAPIPSEADIES